MCRTILHRVSLSFGILALISGVWLQPITLAQSGVPADNAQEPDPTRRGNRPVVTIDKADYAPGDTVVIEGSGFQPSEIVTLQVLHADGSDQGGEGHEPWSINADSLGGIATTWYVNPDDSLGATFQLTVTSAAGTYHVAVFTDGNFTHTMHAYHTGWYDADFSGNSIKGNDPNHLNYFTGWIRNDPVSYRSFFVFHLPPANIGRVTGASFSAVNNGGRKAGGGGDGEYVRFILNDVTVPISVLNAGGRNNEVVRDLAVGTRYADLFIFDPNESPITAEFGCEAIDAIQAALGGDFAIAGWVPGLGNNVDHHLFRNTADPNGVLLRINYTTDLITTTVTTSNVTVTYGPSQTTLQATLTPSQGCPLEGRPITFSVNNNFMGTASTDANGVARLTVSNLGGILGAGLYSIKAQFQGETQFPSSTGFATLTINKATPTITVTVPGTQPFIYNGQSHGAFASVTGAFGESLPLTGIDYQGNGPMPPSLPGTYPILAFYNPQVSGNNNYNFAQNTSKSIVIVAAPTTTTISSTPNPSTFGQSVTITASVSSPGGTPPGDLQIVDAFNGQQLAIIPNGGSFTVKNLLTGPRQLTARYFGAFIAGRQTFQPSQGFTNHTVNRATPTIAVSNAPNPTVFGQPVTFTATIGGVGGAPVQPQFGGVLFSEGGAHPFGSVGIGPNGTAVFSTSSLPAGTHTIAAAYTGDNNYGPASVEFSHTVNKAATTTVVTSGSPAAAFGERVSFTVTAAAVAPGGGVPSGGTAKLFVDGTPAGSAALVNGSAAIEVLNGSVLSPGAHQVTAEFLGSANHDGSTSAAITQHVSKAATTTTLSSGTNPSTYGQQVTFTATVAAPGLPGVAATGMVIFRDGTADLGTGTLVDGVASFVTATLSGGTHHVTAAYAGDASLQTSQSANVLQVVRQAAATVSVAGYAGIFDGQAHGAGGSATGVNGDDVSSLLDFGATFVNVPGGTAHWTFAGNTNYLPAGGDAAIVIAPRPVTIAADAVAKLLGAADPPLTYHVVSGSLVGGSVVTGALTRVPGETAGSYPITQGTLALDSNYALSYVGAHLTIRYNVCVLSDTTKVHKSGSTIPLKLQLCSAAGDNLSSSQLSVHAVGVSQVSSATTGTPEDAGNANPDGDFRLVDGPPVSYMFNLKTTGLAPGTYHLTFTAGGGPVVYVVPFQLR